MKSCCFFLYLINHFHLVTSATLHYALVGKNVTLKGASDTSEIPSEILWKHNGNKVVEFNGQTQLEFSPFENRLTLNWHTAELQIKKLNNEDSGTYDLEIFINKNLKMSSFELQVIDPVPKPSISCAINTESDATLTCSTEAKGSNLEFSWVPPGKEKSSKLEIKLGGEHDSEVYKCTVKNPKSEESASFTAKDCHPENNSIALIVGIVVGLLVLALVLFFLYTRGCFSKQENNVGYHEEEKQTASGSAKNVEENTGGEGGERKCLLGREETMPSNQPLPQWKMRNESKNNTKDDKLINELRQSIRQRDLEKHQQESPSSPLQPPLKPSRSIVRTPKSQTHSEEGEVSGDAEEKGPDSEPPPNEKATDEKPEKNQLESPSSPLQPPLKPSRSIVRTPKSQTHSEEGEVSGDAEEKGPDSEPPPNEKATDVKPGSEKNQCNVVAPLIPVAVELHNVSMTDTEHPDEKELIRETEATVSESDPPNSQQKADAESDLEKNEKVSFSPLVPPKPSRSIKESNKPAEKAESPKENASVIDPSVSDVLPGSDLLEDEHKQPKFSSDTSVSAPAGLPASPLTQKTPPNEAAEQEEKSSTDQASTEPSERPAEEPELKDLQRKNEAVNEVKTPPPHTPEPDPITGAEQQEEDEQVPAAEEDDTLKENGHLSTQEQDHSLNPEPNESFLTSSDSPKLSPKQVKAGSDSSPASKQDEGSAALSEQKHLQCFTN